MVHSSSMTVLWTTINSSDTFDRRIQMIQRFLHVRCWKAKSKCWLLKIVFCSIFISNDCHLMFWLNRIFHQISYKLNILYAKFNMLTVFLTYENNMAPVSTVPSIWSSKLNSGNLHKWHTTIPTISPINLYLLVIHKVLRLKEYNKTRCC